MANSKIHQGLEEFLMKGSKIGTQDGSYIKVMAVADGYVLARYKGCVPFVESIHNFILMVSVKMIKDHVDFITVNNYVERFG